MGITVQASVSVYGQLWLYGSLSLLGGKILQKMIGQVLYIL